MGNFFPGLLSLWLQVFCYLWDVSEQNSLESLIQQSDVTKKAHQLVLSL